MSRTTTLTHEQVENLIKRINEIENARPTQSADEIVARLSALFPENIEVWVASRRLTRYFEEGWRHHEQAEGCHPAVHISCEGDSAKRQGAHPMCPHFLRYKFNNGNS